MGFFDRFKKKERKENSLEEMIKQNEEESRKFKILVDRNLDGMELEKQGKIEEAIKLYEENLKDNFDGSHPYNRLAIIYRKKKLYNEEKRVLEKAIEIFSNISSDRSDRDVKLNKFKDRLNTLNEKYF